MPVTIKLADNALERDEVYKIRHHVFAEEEGHYPRSEDKRIIDRFDTFTSTGNVIAVSNKKVIGSLRVCMDEPGIGLPADEFFNFREHFPSDAKIIHGGHFCVAKEYRGSMGIAISLVRMASYYAITHGATHVALPSNPQYEKLFRNIGYQKIGEPFVDAKTNLPTLPMAMEFAKMNDFFLDFVKQNQLVDFIGDYERCFYEKGETIIHAGFLGDTAYILIDGEAQVILPRSGQVIGLLEAGDLFGELSLLADCARTAHVVASTDVQVMTLSREKFEQHLIQNPKSSLNLIHLLGKRIKTLIAQLESRPYDR